MATILLLKADELTKNTILGGNIDVSKYTPSIKACQQTKIKSLLGKELYTKICEDFKLGTLTGVYLELYEDYIKELVIHGSAEIYLSVGAYNVSSGGITKLQSMEGQTSISKEEVDFLVQASMKLYNQYERDFLKHIKTIDIPEYKRSCSTNRINVGGWSLKRRGCY